MVAAPDATNPSPWLADSLTYALGPATVHTWTMTVTNELWLPSVSITVAPWDVTVDIDARRIPIATARFSLPADVLAANPDHFGFPNSSARVTLHAGWRRDAGDDLHPIFQGVISSIDVHNGVAVCEAVTFDQLMTRPNIGYTVPASYSTFQEVWTNYVRLYWGVVTMPSLDVVGSLPAPSASQLAAFRGAPLGGSWIEALNTLAIILGLWLRGSLTGPGWLTLSARYDSGTPLDLTRIIDPDTIHLIQNVEEFAGGVLLTANWRDGGVDKNSTNYYFGGEGGFVGRYESVPAKAITIYYRPPSGTLTDADLIGKAYANAYRARTWQTTGQGRAIWWLQPRQIVTIGDRTGQIETINLDVDAGTATYTIRPTSAY